MDEVEGGGGCRVVCVCVGGGGGLAGLGVEGKAVGENYVGRCVCERGWAVGRGELAMEGRDGRRWGGGGDACTAQF